MYSIDEKNYKKLRLVLSNLYLKNGIDDEVIKLSEILDYIILQDQKRKRMLKLFQKKGDN